VRLEESIPDAPEDFLKVSALEMVWYMRDQLLRVADWAGVAHSLEIRVPRVDIVLLRKIAPRLASNYRPGKLDMAGTLSPPWPDAVLRRAKSGFFVPVRRWLAAAPPKERAVGTMTGAPGLGWFIDIIPANHENPLSGIG